MRLGLLGCLLALVFTGSFPGLAEQPAGPATLENLAQPEETQDAAADADNGSTAGRPAGTLVRPKDGVQHPDLDRAWAVYAEAVGKAAEEIRAAVEKQFEKAAADGNLPAVKKWKAVGAAFDDQGTVPVEKEVEKLVKAVTEAFAKANENLRKAYEQTIKALTKQAVKDKAMVEEAEEVEAEWKSLAAQAVLQPKPGEWVSIFGGVRTDGWGNGWGEKVEVVQKSLRLQGQNSGITFVDMAAGDLLAIEARICIRRVNRPDARAKLGLSSCDQGTYWLEVDARGKAVIAQWDPVVQRLRPIKEFGVVLRPGQEHIFRFERSHDRLIAFFDGVQMATTPVPKPVLPAGMVQIAVGGLTADFSDIRVMWLDGD